MRKRGLLWFILGSLFVLVGGCGGGGGQPETGRAKVSVSWPTSTRLIPFASSSIRVLVTQAGQPTAQAILERPSGGGLAIASFDRLPTGPASVLAVAYPEPAAAGTAQASGSVSVEIVKSQVASVQLTMSSTIQSASILPAASTLPVGGSVVLAPSFLNGAGQGIIVSLATQRWTSSNPAIATVEAGRVVGVAAGTATIDVVDTESGKTASAQITVTAGGGGGGGGTGGNVTFNPANGHYYQAVSVPAGITWFAAKTAAEARGGYLATITNAAENTFVFSLVDAPQYWKDGDSGYAPDANLGPWLGAFRSAGFTDPLQGWQWVSGEAWNYTNWHPNQPDSGNNLEDRLHFLTRPPGSRQPRWNDLINDGTPGQKNPVGYVIEWNADPGSGGGGGGGGGQTSLDPSSGLQPPVFTGPPSASVPTFATPVYYNLGTAPGESKVADFDLDGKLDIVLACGTNLLMFYGRGDGSFDTPVAIHTKIDGYEPVQIADMNNDGKIDVIAADRLDKIHVVLNLGSRSFATSKFVGGIRPRDMTIGDFNRDGNRDVAVDDGYSLTVFLGDGSGGLARKGSKGGSGTLDGLSCADFNKDGILDVVATSNSSIVDRSGIQVFLGNGDGTFATGGTHYSGTATGLFAFVQDFNRDGTWDAAISMFHDRNLAVFLGLGTGSFQQRTLYSQPSSWKCLAVDLNKDGYPDIVSPNTGSSQTISVFRNLGNGLFADRVTYPSDGNDTLHLSSGDFNGDGKNDLAISCAGANKLAIHLNTTP